MANEEFGSSAPKQTRSQANTNDAEFNHVELPPPQRKQAVDTSLMVLNDDCLLKIFEKLRPINLRYVLQVNVRLEALVKYYVQFKYQIETEPKICPDFTNDDIERMGYRKAKLYLQLFGHEIRSLNIDFTPFLDNANRYNKVTRLVKYCRANKMTLISRLGYQTTNTHIYMTHFYFEQLYELRIEHIHYFLHDHVLERLVSGCINLKRLSLVCCRELTTGCFKSIGTLENLEEFEYKMCHAYAHAHILVKLDLKHLLSLKKLKVLKFGLSPELMKHYSVFEFLDELVKRGSAIEHLELAGVRCDDWTSESIAQLQSIKILKLNYLAGLRKAHVVHIAQKLNLLQELHIRMNTSIARSAIKEIVYFARQLSCLKIDAKGLTFGFDKYQEISTIVRNRPNKNKLELTIYGDDSQQFLTDQANTDQLLLVKHLKRTDVPFFCVKSAVFYGVGRPKVRSLDENDESEESDEFGEIDESD